MKKLILIKLNIKLFKFFLISLIIFSVIVWTLQSIKYFDFVIEDGHGLNVYFFYTLLNFPKIIHRILPFIFFISLFYTLIIYEKDGELDLFWFNGVSKIFFIKNLLIFSILLTIFQIILGSYISPLSQYKARNHLKNSNIDFFSSLIKDGKFINITQGLTIYIKDKNLDGSFDNIFLNDENESSSKMIYAKKGILIDNKKIKIFRLYDGQVINISTDRVNIFDFEEIDFNLQNLESKTITMPKIQELNSKILLGCLFNFIEKSTFFNCEDNLKKEIKQELIKRFIKPIYIPLISLLCAFILIFSKKNINYKKIINLIFITTFLILLISEITLRYLSSSNHYLIIYLMIPLVIFSISFNILAYKIKNV